MKDKNIIKQEDKHSLLGYMDAGVLSKVNKDFIKENKSYFEEFKLKKIKQGFLGYEEWLLIEGLNINSVKEIKVRLVKEVKDIIKELEQDKIYSLLINAYPINDKKKI